MTHSPAPEGTNPFANPDALPTADSGAAHLTEAALRSRDSWQPPGLVLLFFVEMWERFSYYGMRALLVLYLVALLPTAATVRLAGGTDARFRTGETVKATMLVEGKPTTIEGEAVKVADGSLTIRRDVETNGETRSEETVVEAGAATSIEVSRPANGGRNWSKAEATTLYGWYTGLAYLLPILGGLIADKLIGTHRSMLVGGITIALGHIALAASGLGDWSTSATGMSIFMGGLSLIVIGTGHFKPCVSVMVGQLYSGPEDPRRDGGFSIFYMGINLGAFICAFVCGTLGEKVGWHWGFGAAAVGMILGLAMYIWGRRRFLEGVGLPPEGKPNYAPFFVVLALVLSAGVAWFFHAGGFGAISRGFEAIATNLGHGATVAAILLLMTALIGWLLAIQAREDVPKVAAILVFILFNTFFWMAFEQAGSTLNLFAEEKTNLSLGGWSMPASWFQSVNPALIILLAPLFAFIWPALAKRKLEPKQPGKIGWGLLLLGIGYIVMVFGGQAAATGVKVSMFYLFLTYFFHTLGELCLSPTGLSFVTKAAPMKFVSLLMGIWFLSSFAAGVLGGAIGSYVEEIEKGTVRLPWSGTFGGQGDFFALFVVSSIGAAIVIFALSPVLNRMSREV